MIDIGKATRKLFCGVALVGLGLATESHAATELEEREAIVGQVSALFLAEDFGALEQLSRRFRATESRTASGLWHLTLFYAGIKEAINDKQHSASIAAAYAGLEATTLKWADAFPDSPTARIVHAMVLVDRGWAYRGSGLARSVPSAAWAPFHESIASARTYLETHKQTASVDPQWYEVMVTIAKAEGWDLLAFGALLNEALVREPLFYETYFRAMEYLLPKWYGSVPEIEAFAATAAERTAADDGDGMYARIYWYASQVEYEDDLFARTLAQWPRMSAAFDDVIAKYPDAWNLNNFAKFACLARDRQKTVELFERIGDEVVPEAWGPALYTECSFWLLLPERT